MMRFANAFRKIRNFIRHARTHLARGDFSGWLNRLRAQFVFSTTDRQWSITRALPDQSRFAILNGPASTPQAQILARRLHAHGWQAEIVADGPLRFEYDWYFVLLPNALTALPPARKRILWLHGLASPIVDDDLRNFQKSAAILASTPGDIAYLAAHGVAYPQVHHVPMPENEESVQHDTLFTFMIDRFLVAQGFLPLSYVDTMQVPLPSGTTQVALSMPETVVRRIAFEKTLPSSYRLFCGLRRQPGWVGCGLSYRSLARYAIARGLPRLAIMEDDIVLPADFESKIRSVQAFLDARSGQWHVFAGMIAALDAQVTVHAVEKYEDMTFVTLDKMTSMVFNIYESEALRMLAAWNPELERDPVNTIDRHLGGQAGLRVIVTLPFLVGHCEEMQSTLWGGSNKLYSELIRSSEQALMDKVSVFQKEAAISGSAD
jgi:hypothetical protein